MFDLKSPCKTCPFRKGMGEKFQLSRERLDEIKEACSFTCHKTIDYGASEIPEELVERFHARYKINPKTKCWEWTSTLDAYGYGCIGFGPRKKRKTWKAHRLSWEIHTSVVPPPEIDICHSCDVRKCVNPDHLFVGDNAINMLDAVSKGRRSNYRPIPIDDVIAMREEYEYGSREHGVNALAKKYQCSSGQVHNIVTMHSRVEYKNDKPQQCAGLMAVLLREYHTNTIMRLAILCNQLKPDELDPRKEAYRSWKAVLKAHGAR